MRWLLRDWRNNWLYSNSSSLIQITLTHFGSSCFTNAAISSTSSLSLCLFSLSYIGLCFYSVLYTFYLFE